MDAAMVATIKVSNRKSRAALQNLNSLGQRALNNTA